MGPEQVLPGMEHSSVSASKQRQAVAICPLSHPHLASTLHTLDVVREFDKRESSNLFFFIIYFQLPNLWVVRNETTSSSALLTTE